MIYTVFSVFAKDLYNVNTGFANIPLFFCSERIKNLYFTAVDIHITKYLSGVIYFANFIAVYRIGRPAVFIIATGFHFYKCKNPCAVGDYIYFAAFTRKITGKYFPKTFLRYFSASSSPKLPTSLFVAILFTQKLLQKASSVGLG